MPLLQVNNLKTHFFSDNTVTKAADGIDLPQIVVPVSMLVPGANSEA